MARASEMVEGRLLGELFDDGKQPRRDPQRLPEASNRHGLEELVHRAANEVPVPQFHLDELVARVLVLLGRHIEQELERTDNQDIRNAVDRLQIPPNLLLRITLKITARILQDREIRGLIDELLATQPNGKCIAAMTGQISEVSQILQQAGEQGDEVCLKQLENYAKQLVATYHTEHNKSNHAQAVHPASGKDETR